MVPTGDGSVTLRQLGAELDLRLGEPDPAQLERPQDAVADGALGAGVGYGILRSLQLRWIRLPKPQVKLGAKLPQRY